MIAKIVSALFVVIVVAYASFFSFSPEPFQKNFTWKILAIVAAVFTVLFTVYNEWGNVKKYSYAFVSSKDGTILEKNNFPWTVQRIDNPDGSVIYTIVNRSGDPTDVEVETKNGQKVEIDLSWTGVFVKFQNKENLSDFKIVVSR